MNDRFDEAWRAFSELDRQLRAPRDLEARVLAAVARPPSRTSTLRSERIVIWAAAAAVLIVIAAALSMRSPSPVAPLEAQAPTPVMLQPPIEPRRPAVEAAASMPRLSRRPLPHIDDAPLVVMIFDAPALPEETLQLVRLRIPKDALAGLGMELFGPEVDGLVDVDVLVGEDGLPKDIRKIRVEQEER
jgi:hypothetical protein